MRVVGGARGQAQARRQRRGGPAQQARVQAQRQRRLRPVRRAAVHGRQPVHVAAQEHIFNSTILVGFIAYILDYTFLESRRFEHFTVVRKVKVYPRD